MFRRPRQILVAAVVLYVIGLAVAWQLVDSIAGRRVQAILESAERSFSDVIDGELDAALRYVGGAIVNMLGGESVPRSVDRMKELAATFNLDEVNIVDDRGIVIGSNVPSVLGYDFSSHPLTRDFLALTNADTTIVTHPFRHGVANPEMYCKYHGMAFPGHRMFLQLGVTQDRLRQNMYSYTSEESDRILKSWHFSVAGWYERATTDPEFKPGKYVTRWNAGCREMIIGRFFDYRGYRYVAYIPKSYCYSQRNYAFAVTAFVLGVLLALFSYFLIRLAKASVKLEAMHDAAKARTAADLALARTIQMSALPSSDRAFMDRLSFSLAAECHPAREVGGDFYDFFSLPGDRVAFLVADVSGKGIPGAMFMMEAKNVLKNCLVGFADVAEAVAEANRRLCANNRAELFVTAWVGVLDREGVVEYVNAGHSRPFVRHADGSVVKVIGRGGRFLGMFEDAAYRVNTVRLAPGDVLYLYTDGVTEAMNAAGELFGDSRLCEELAVRPRGVKAAVDRFVSGAEQSDDVTELLLFWHGCPETRSRDFAADAGSLEPALTFVRESFAPVSDRKAVSALLNAADEVTSNIVNYSGATGFRVEVERSVNRLRLRVSDDGRAYNPLLHVDPDTHAAIEDRPVGGLGLVVVKRLTDRVVYSYEGGRNVLTLIRSYRPEDRT